MKRVIVAAMILVIGLAVWVAAEEKGKVADVKTGKTTIADSKDIEQKKTAIMKIMNQGQFKARTQYDNKFCANFLNGFSKQQGVEYSNPIVAVDDYNDPKLQDYLKQCPNKEFHKSVEISHAQTLREIADREQQLGRALTKEELEVYGGIEYYATKNFKLYKVNINNNAKNGDEYVFYAEGYKNSINKYTYGGYTIIDLHKCTTMGAVLTTDPFDYNKHKPIENYNGIIKYKSEYYVFELNNFAGGMLVFQKYNKERKNINVKCRYYLEK